VVEAARDAPRDAFVERARRRGERAAVGEQHRRPERRRPRNFCDSASARGSPVRTASTYAACGRAGSALHRDRHGRLDAHAARPATASATSWNFRIGIT
jgi:hypothetical protein